MAIDENTRLTLRQAFETLIGADLAAAVMEAMPNLDYSQLATKTDVANTEVTLRGELAELRGEMTVLRGEMAELRGETKQEIAALSLHMSTNLRTMVFTQIATTIALGGFVAGFG